MLEVVYVPYLIIASVAIAIMSAFTSLRLTSGLAVLGAHQRKVRITKAAFALGGGIWSMHFVGMISVDVGIPIFYDPLRTLGSALIAILLTGVALMSLHFGVRTPVRIILAGIITGVGIISMHYLGMSAISGNCIVNYEASGVMLAIGIAMVSCILAMELAYRKRSMFMTICGSVVLGLSISAVHYSAMLYTTFSVAQSVSLSATQVMSSNNLALIVAISAFLTCGWFLLTAVSGESEPAVSVGSTPEPETALAQENVTLRNRNASSLLSKAFDETMPTKDQLSGLSDRIPYERDKTLRFISTDSLVYVQADGHYSRIANSENEYFCPWSLSRVEKTLDSVNFIRTHRSYLVNKNYITGFRREGDKGVCIVGKNQEKEIPVSRGRVSEIQDLLGI